MAGHFPPKVADGGIYAIEFPQALPWELVCFSGGRDCTVPELLFVNIRSAAYIYRRMDFNNDSFTLSTS